MEEKSTGYWQNLFRDYSSYLESATSRTEVLHYKRSMQLLIDFAESKGITEYTPETGMAFFDSEKQKDYRGSATLSRRRIMLKRLNEYLFGCTFWHRANFGRVYKRVKQQCPVQFSEEFEKFLDSLQKVGLKEITIKMYRSVITKMLCEFDEEGVNGWGELGAKHLTAAYIRSKNKFHFVPYARRFFKHLSEAGLTEHNYSVILPSPVHNKPIPSVYSQKELQQLFNSIEVYTPVGRRDFAIVSLISGVGIRASDVAFLRFENVDFERHLLNFTQYKTGVPQRLKLPTDVAEAMRNYIDKGREHTEESAVFLNGSGKPLTTDDVSTIVQRRFEESGIDYNGRHHGANALRASYASMLVEGGVPYEAVRVLMGHLRPETTKHYVKFAIEDLRRCALDVPMPTGYFKAYLESEDDVLLRIF